MEKHKTKQNTWHVPWRVQANHYCCAPLLHVSRTRRYNIMYVFLFKIFMFYCCIDTQPNKKWENVCVRVWVFNKWCSVNHGHHTHAKVGLTLVSCVSARHPIKTKMWCAEREKKTATDTVTGSNDNTTGSSYESSTLHLPFCSYLII